MEPNILIGSGRKFDRFEDRSEQNPTASIDILSIENGTDVSVIATLVDSNQVIESSVAAYSMR